MSDQPGRLYLVPTPIGNMEDITLRAITVLREVDIIACEDTRTTGSLLRKLDIHKKLISYHDFNESARAAQLAEMIRNGQSVAVVTDAGSPGVSDPAYRVVRTAIDSGLTVVPLPGASALIPALTASGLPTDRFFFEGFLPNKSARRRNRLSQLADMEHTLIFYESPHRLVKALTDIRDTLGDRQICVAREISKLHEEFCRGTASDVLARFAKGSVKGEIVIVVDGLSRRARHDTKEDEEGDDDE